MAQRVESCLIGVMVPPKSARAALIIGHPGHETLLHHWIERERPVVFVLTDGSGGGAVARTTHSRRLIEFDRKRRCNLWGGVRRGP